MYFKSICVCKEYIVNEKTNPTQLAFSDLRKLKKILPQTIVMSCFGPCGLILDVYYENGNLGVVGKLEGPVMPIVLASYSLVECCLATLNGKYFIAIRNKHADIRNALTFIDEFISPREKYTGFGMYLKGICIPALEFYPGSPFAFRQDEVPFLMKKLSQSKVLDENAKELNATILDVYHTLHGIGVIVRVDDNAVKQRVMEGKINDFTVMMDSERKQIVTLVMCRQSTFVGKSAFIIV